MLDNVVTGMVLDLAGRRYFNEGNVDAADLNRLIGYALAESSLQKLPTVEAVRHTAFDILPLLGGLALSAFLEMDLPKP